MEFKVFAKKLKDVIGGTSNTKIFTKTIFEAMMNDSGPALLEDISPDTFKAYFNGNTSISKAAALILANLSDDDEFPSYLEGFGATTAQLLADEFEDDIPDINAVNASTKITELFLEILREASGKKKGTPKSAKRTDDKTPHDILVEKMLDSGQAIANVWDKAISNLSESTSATKENSTSVTDTIEIPEKQSSDDYPYSSEDKILLQDFTADYDEIMVTMVGENYAVSLIDMTLPSKIQELYTAKWKSKADAFLDLSLKSNVFGLLGELNKLSESFLAGSLESPSIKNTRTKIRNLYVKLHPDLFAGGFPYDAFIDDWEDGEF